MAVLQVTTFAAFIYGMTPLIPDRMPETCVLVACLLTLPLLHYRYVSCPRTSPQQLLLLALPLLLHALTSVLPVVLSEVLLAQLVMDLFHAFCSIFGAASNGILMQCPDMPVKGCMNPISEKQSNEYSTSHTSTCSAQVPCTAAACRGTCLPV